MFYRFISRRILRLIRRFLIYLIEKMRLKIKGVRTKKQKVEINIKLEDAGYTACEVDDSLDTIIIPDIYLGELDEISLVLATIGDFQIEEF